MQLTRSSEDIWTFLFGKQCSPLPTVCGLTSRPVLLTHCSLYQPALRSTSLLNRFSWPGGRSHQPALARCFIFRWNPVESAAIPACDTARKTVRRTLPANLAIDPRKPPELRDPGLKCTTFKIFNELNLILLLLLSVKDYVLALPLKSQLAQRLALLLTRCLSLNLEDIGL